MEYTFSSTEAENYNEVVCPVNYMGASVQLKWYVSYMNGKANTILLDTDDYVDINEERYYINDTYTNFDNLITILTEFFNQATLSVETDKAGRLTIFGKQFFTINGMSLHMKYATGFHYLKDVSLTSLYDEVNEYYFIKCKATPFDYLTPIWYIVSNLGSPNQIASMTEKYKIYYPAVAVKIVNTFSDGQAMSVSNGDYQTVSQASSLSNLKLKIVDANLEPIKFLNPIFLTVCMEEIPLEESIEQAIAEQPPNKAYVEQIRQRLEMNYQKLEALLGKTEQGVAVEPQIAPFEERPEYNQPPPLPMPPKLASGDQQAEPAVIIPDETPGVNEETREVLNEVALLHEVELHEVDTTKDDDRTEEKEQGMVEQQETHEEEN